MPTRVLLKVAGPAVTHIVICERQGRRLRQLYSESAVIRVVPNAALKESSVHKPLRARTRVARIGFLGNISRKKGILELLAVAECLERSASGLEVYIAGPFENGVAEAAVRNAERCLRTIKYLGPRYGPEKESFWEDIDVLLFPSQYENETAPLVVHEAMEHGIPVIAWNRGCLCDMVLSQSGLLIDCGEDFVAAAVDCLLAWQQDSNLFKESSIAALRAYGKQHQRSRESFEELLTDLCHAVSSPQSARKCTVRPA